MIHALSLGHSRGLKKCGHTDVTMTYLIYNTVILYVASVQQLLSVINTIAFYGYFLESKRNWTETISTGLNFVLHRLFKYLFFYSGCFELQASSFFYTWVYQNPFLFDSLFLKYQSGQVFVRVFCPRKKIEVHLCCCCFYLLVSSLSVCRIQ